MASKDGIKIKEELLAWAIQESGKSLDQVAAHFKDLQAWLAQEEVPTFQQLEDLAHFLGVPLGLLFLDRPPQTDLLAGDYRSLARQAPKVSKELKASLYEMGRKRDWLREYRQAQGWERLVPGGLIDPESQDPAKIAGLVREWLTIDPRWYESHSQAVAALAYLRERAENCGLVVMRKDRVRTDPQRRLDPEEFRGFLLYDPLAPLLFINSGDSLTGQIATLIHGAIYFLLGEEHLLLGGGEPGPGKEEIIARARDEVLMPAAQLERRWDPHKPAEQQVRELSRTFHVSELALGCKLRALKKIDQKTRDRLRLEQDLGPGQENEGARSGSQEIDPQALRSQYGDNFLRALVQGTEAGDLGYTRAFRLLDHSAQAYDALKEAYQDQAGPEGE